MQSMKKSGCYRDEIYKVRFDPIENDVLWILRGVTSKFTDLFNRDDSPSRFRNETVEE